MAISEIEEFISDKKEEITDINNLDDDDWLWQKYNWMNY
jgi:hypothetical protein